MTTTPPPPVIFIGDNEAYVPANELDVLNDAVGYLNAKFKRTFDLIEDTPLEVKFWANEYLVTDDKTSCMLDWSKAHWRIYGRALSFCKVCLNCDCYNCV